jgi:hypothetical protein
LRCHIKLGYPRHNFCAFDFQKRVVLKRKTLIFFIKNLIFMSRRNNDLISLSFFDVLTSALGAVIFLFIIVPKIDMTQSQPSIAAETKDTVRLDLDTALVAVPTTIITPMNLNSSSLSIVSTMGFGNSYYRFNGSGNSNFLGQMGAIVLPKICKNCPKTTGQQPLNSLIINTKPSKMATPVFDATKPQKIAPIVPVPPIATFGNDKKEPVIQSVVKTEPRVNTSPLSNPAQDVNLKRPTNPCRVAFEIKWQNTTDNVDLIVYRGADYVSGKNGYRQNAKIGEWDSGRSRQRLFNNDLRTNQEAVRQFNGIIAGEYQLYAVFKETAKADSLANINVTGLIYTQSDKGEEKSTTFAATIPYNPKGKQLIGSVAIKPDGTFHFTKM